MLKEFRDFAVKGNVIDLAVGVIIGAAFTAIVTSLVNDILMPPLGFLMGGIDFSNFFIDLTYLTNQAAIAAAEAAGSAVPGAAKAFDTLKGAQEAGHVVIAYGKFLNACISFLIVAFVIFLVVKQINRLKREAPAEPPAAPPEELQVLREIRDLLAKR